MGRGSSAPTSSLALCAWAEVQREFTHRGNTATLDFISHSVHVLLFLNLGLSWTKLIGGNYNRLLAFLPRVTWQPFQTLNKELSSQDFNYVGMSLVAFNSFWAITVL